jgi:hypothetical protein
MSKNTPAEESNPEDPGAEESVPMNRAERRAKGKKGAGQGAAQGKAKFNPKSNQAHGPRLWANRRAG